ncbi:MAG: hypothetical protein J6S67_19255 [Methanobrevibacter sp.]|nr:hypothetical protein [Methanobrevibacter sp.]
MRKDCRNAYNQTIASLKAQGIKFDLYEDLLYISKHGFLGDGENKDEYKYYTDYIKEIALKQVTKDSDNADRWRNLYWETVKTESFWYFESFLIYMEHKRPYERRFYEPRMNTQHIVVEDLQSLEDHKNLKLYALSEPARVGKSAMILFFLAWNILRHPHSHNAMGTYSGPAAKHFYKEFLKIVSNSEEYCYQELWSYFNPKEKFITDQSSEDMIISFTGVESFASISFRGIDGSWTGLVDVSDDGYLAVDDLIRDREHALSKTRSDKTFAEYVNKMMDRMHEFARQLMIGTLWNIYDPIARTEEAHKNDERYVFRKIPALDENDESNFDYEYNGYSTEYYRELRELMIYQGLEADWFAKFQQAPYRREGILFPDDELRFFNGILPLDHKYTFITVCDVAFGGGDSVSMPIGLQDEDTNWIYIVDWYFNNKGVKITVPGVADMIMKYGIKEITFEKNNGGQLYADDVQEELEKRKYICSCNTKPAPNMISKQDKIKGCEGKIKAMIIFLDRTKRDKELMAEQEMQKGTDYFERTPEYEKAMDELSIFASIGKNEHDDAADSIAQLCIKAFGDLNGLADVETIDRVAYGF